MKLLIIGSGYVGLVAGTCFAEMGHHVLCLDKNREKIATLSEGEVPFYEPGLKEMILRNVQAKRLSFTADYDLAATHGEVCFIAVDTPPLPNGAADISRIKEVAESLALRMDGYRVFVNKSTVPVGTARILTALIQETLAKRGVSYPFDVVSNPEFLKEGDGINDFMKPDRVVIGADSVQALQLMEQIYAPFMLNHSRLMAVDTVSAELIKYAANAMLATRISFMNELSILCEKVGGDITKVRRGIGADKRIGNSFLYPGLGYGGSCFPKDLRALQATGREHGCELTLLSTVQSVNERQKIHFFEKISHYFSSKGGLQGKKLGILGLSFKPNTDDMREAPSLPLIRKLIDAGASLNLFDPVAMDHAKLHLEGLPRITWCKDEASCAEGTDALVLVTEWHQFRLLDLEATAKKMRSPILFDGRNQYEPERMHSLGWDYLSIGRRDVRGFSEKKQLERAEECLTY
jgi:UDPglucose 6-dehydrogenase